MTILIHPGRVRTTSTSGGKTGAKRLVVESNVPPAEMNIIPSVEELQSLIHDAVMALSRGFAWNRGAILNLVV